MTIRLPVDKVLTDDLTWRLVKTTEYVHAEIWPGVVRDRAERLMHQNTNLIKDQAQVRAMCEWAAELDSQGAFGQHFNAPIDLSQSEIQSCIEQEGWILGSG